jgi:hypothetical protein
MKKNVFVYALFISLAVFASNMVFAQTSSVITVDQFNAGITKEDDNFIYSTVNGRQYVVNKARQLPYKMWTGTSWEPVDVGPQRESDFEHTVTNGKVTITGYKGTMINVVIPSTINGQPVVAIGDYAFIGTQNPDAIAYSGVAITSVTIPGSVKTIGESAFKGNKLNSVTFGNGVISIGRLAFSSCGLPSVTFPDSVTTIGDFAFQYNNFTSITFGKGITTIGGSAFDYSTAFNQKASITFSDSITSIGGSAFGATSWLADQPNGVVYAGKVAYLYKGDMPANTSITLLDGTKGIADAAFRDCKGLVSITIPSSVTSIGNGAFNGCTGLTSVTFQGTIPSSGFKRDAFAYQWEKEYISDLRDKYLAGGPGRYTRVNSESKTWTKQ